MEITEMGKMRQNKDKVGQTISDLLIVGFKYVGRKNLRSIYSSDLNDDYSSK